MHTPQGLEHRHREEQPCVRGAGVAEGTRTVGPAGAVNDFDLHKTIGCS